jgi:hypothetical protein
MSIAVKEVVHAIPQTPLQIVRRTRTVGHDLNNLLTVI